MVAGQGQPAGKIELDIQKVKERDRQKQTDRETDNKEEITGRITEREREM